MNHTKQQYQRKYIMTNTINVEAIIVKHNKVTIDLRLSNLSKTYQRVITDFSELHPFFESTENAVVNSFDENNISVTIDEVIYQIHFSEYNDFELIK